MTPARLDHCKAILERLIAFETVSTDSNFDMIHYLAGLLTEAGATVDVMTSPEGGKANIFATLGKSRQGGLLLSGHTDVVPVEDQDWSSDPFKMVEKNDRLYGRGTCDMKGFIAACMASLDVLKDASQYQPIHFAFTHDEEVGCLGAHTLVQEMRERDLRPRLAIVGEPTSMRIIEGHKGCCEYTVTFSGTDGHGSRPEIEVNAVEYATQYVTRLLEVRKELEARAPEGSQFVPPWSTINVGALHGGSAHNVIASKATLEWETRPVNMADLNYVKDEMAACQNALIDRMHSVSSKADIHLEIIGETPGLEPMKNNEARDLVSTLTGANGSDLVPFGTEAGLFQGLGMDVVVCGPGSIEQAHKADEFVSFEQLDLCLDMLARLPRALAASA